MNNKSHADLVAAFEAARTALYASETKSQSTQNRAWRKFAAAEAALKASPLLGGW